MRTRSAEWTRTAAVTALILVTAAKFVHGENQNENCGLGKTPKDDIAKIRSYKVLRGNDTYLQGLFPKYKNPKVRPKLPVFVTAVSSSHFLECMVLLRHMKNIKNKYRDLKLVIYDTGLKKTQRTLIQTACSCDVRTFPFQDFPQHAKKLNILAWKPIVIQLALKDLHSIVWMDTSIRLNVNGTLDRLFEAGKKIAVMASYTGDKSTIVQTTDKMTFKHFDENPCSFETMSSISSGFVLLHANEHVFDYLMRPWVACALSPGCAEVGDSPF